MRKILLKYRNFFILLGMLVTIFGTSSIITYVAVKQQNNDISLIENKWESGNTYAIFKSDGKIEMHYVENDELISTEGTYKICGNKIKINRIDSDKNEFVDGIYKINGEYLEIRDESGLNI